MIFDFSAAAHGIQHSFAVWVGQKFGFNLNINFADTNEDMESDPVTDGN